MSFLSRIFRKPKVECPRCLGKGHVDLDDIKRLKKELRWRTGKCAYCNGKGTVDPEMLLKISADNAYLTTSLPWLERRRLIHKNENAIQRAMLQEARTDYFIARVEDLYFNGKMKPAEIASLYANTNVKELTAYIERIIKYKLEH